MDSPDHMLSVKRSYSPIRSCWNCSRRVRVVVGWVPLCRKHALEEFVRNLRDSIEGRSA